MSDLGPIQSLRSVSPQPAAAPQSATRAVELLTLEAKRGAEPVVTLRVLAQGPDYVVECDVQRIDGRPNEPRSAGPYVFATQREAKAFVDEATTALQYLGCEITEARR